jgi:hypothetical protein
MSKDISTKLHPKKELPWETRKLLAKGYKEGFEEDLEIAQRFCYDKSFIYN